jgi:hypothetical protein
VFRVCSRIPGEMPKRRDFREAEFIHSMGRPRLLANALLNGMNPSKEDKGNRDEEKPRLVPDELENVEGDEEEHGETDLPPAMPPKV